MGELSLYSLMTSRCRVRDCRDSLRLRGASGIIEAMTGTPKTPRDSAHEGASPDTADEQAEPTSTDAAPKEIGGRPGPDPTRYGDWEKNGRCIDF